MFREHKHTTSKNDMSKESISEVWVDGRYTYTLKFKGWCITCGARYRGERVLTPMETYLYELGKKEAKNGLGR